MGIVLYGENRALMSHMATFSAGRCTLIGV
jgi:hypothetical protein